MSQQPSVVVVVDDRAYEIIWITGLRAYADVYHFVDARGNVYNGSPMHCLLIDVIMQTPLAASSKGTSGSHEHGIWLIKQVAERSSNESIPVINLTTRDADTIRISIDALAFPKVLVASRHRTIERRRVLALGTDNMKRWHGLAS